jgi:hypothetical protein
MDRVCSTYSETKRSKSLEGPMRRWEDLTIKKYECVKGLDWPCGPVADFVWIQFNKSREFLDLWDC